MKKKNFKYDVLLFGHGVIDFITDGDKSFIQNGGIYNLDRIFKNYNLKIKTEPSNIGYAFIDIDRNNSTKKSIAKLNAISLNPEVSSCKWMHVAYANMLNKEYTPIDKNSIYSVDLCAGQKIEFSKDPNYIFLSTDEHDIVNFEKNKNSTIIAHSQNDAFLIKNNKILYKEKVKSLKNINVLGAGDALASYFIISKLKNADDQTALRFSLKKVKEFLLTN